MKRLADNTLHPLEIADAREAAYRASEIHKGIEEALRNASRELADAERSYRLALSRRIITLHTVGDPDQGLKPLAISTCETVAKGESEIADLRHARDIAQGKLKAVEQQRFRAGADRAAVARFAEWSMHRDLRTDAPPASWDDQETFGRRAPDFDPATGEIAARRVS